MGKTEKQPSSEPVEETPKVGVKEKFTTLKNGTKTKVSGLLSTKKRRVIAIAAGIVLVLLVLFAVPFTRYAMLGLVVKKDVSLTVVDSKTKQPVSNVSIAVNGVSGQTDKDGKVTVKAVPVGQDGIEISKENYESKQQAYTVPVLFQPESPTIEIVATGRSVVLGVTDKISGDPLADVTLTYGEAKATTNDKGEATLIVSPGVDVQKVTVSKDGYNSQDVEIKSNESAVQAFTITPAGFIYFLSKETGKINVMKSHLDGSSKEVVVQGTGQESQHNTSLLSARDWQYSALLATRTDEKQRLYLINGVNDEFSVIDEGDAQFELVGWSGHNFVYTVNRNNIQIWQSKKYALKSFNADTKEIKTLDESSASSKSQYDYESEHFGSIYILTDHLAYTKSWRLGPLSNDSKSASFMRGDPIAGTRTLVRSFEGNEISLAPYEPKELYLRDSAPSTPVVYEYREKNLYETKNVSENEYYSAYSKTFLLSPSGNKTLWYELRNGKNTVLIGDANAENEKVVASSSDYRPYGWFGQNDEYILLSKDGGELYIASADKVIGKDYTALKITDYHKTLTYSSYGYGYGGL